MNETGFLLNVAPGSVHPATIMYRIKAGNPVAMKTSNSLSSPALVDRNCHFDCRADHGSHRRDGHLGHSRIQYTRLTRTPSTQSVELAALLPPSIIRRTDSSGLRNANAWQIVTKRFAR